MSTPFHNLPQAYIPILTRVQNTYWPAKDRGLKACEVSLEGLTIPDTLEKARDKIAVFLGVRVTVVSVSTRRLRLTWGADISSPSQT